jgi:adenine-specific DNA-methyltransferase
MKIEYKWKKSKTSILKKSNSFDFSKSFVLWENNLIEWDNFEVLKSLLHKEELKWKIDLIYIDPPFATNNIFTIDDDIASSISRTKNWRIAYKDDLKEEEFLEFIRERLIVLNELLSEKW